MHHDRGLTALSNGFTLPPARPAGRVARGAAVLLLLLPAFAVIPAQAQQVQWQNVIAAAPAAGDYRSVEPVAMAADATGVIVAGNVHGRLPGQTWDGSDDLFVLRYDTRGRILWTRQLALPGNQFLNAMAADASGIYLAARDWSVPRDMVARLDPVDGRLLWTRAVGADFTGSLHSLALHPSGVYVGGVARDADFNDPRPFLQRLDRNGTTIWFIDVDVPVVAADQPRVNGIAFGSTGIYVSGEFDSLAGVVLRKFDFGGRWVSDVHDPTGAVSDSGRLVADAEGLVVVANVSRGTNGALVHRYSYDGRLLWKADVPGEYYAAGIAADGGDVYLLTDAHGGVPSSAVRRYGPDGTELWVWRAQPYITFTNEPVFVLAASGGQVYTAARQADPSSIRFTTIVSAFDQDLPAQLQAVRHAGPAPRTALAVLVHDSSTGGVAALVRDAASGALLRRVPFDAAYWPREMVRVPDLNGNGSDELALLGAHRRNGSRAAQIRDSLTGALIARVPFDRGYTPVKMLALPDLNGNGAAELAVLERSTSRYVGGSRNVVAQAEVRDAKTGLVLQRVDFAGVANIEGKTDFVMAADSNGNGSPDLAAVGELSAFSDGAFVAISDPLTGAPLRQQFLPQPQYAARVSLAALPDSDANGLPELGAIAQYEQGTRAFVFEGIPDAQAMITPPKRVIAFPRGDAADRPRPAVIAVPDVSGNGYPELAVLRSRVTAGRDEIQIKDALSGQLVGNFGYPAQGLQFRGVAVIDDLNGNGSSELAVLRRQTATGRLIVLIKDARTGAVIRSIAY